MSIAWVFPGQGSQKIGMADQLLKISGAKERFSIASELIGRDLFAICQGTSKETTELGNLNDTRNTQIALFVVESLLVDNLLSQGREPFYLAGHSLGEFVALYAAQVFNLEEALGLIKLRSELMSQSMEGAMTALIGFDKRQLDKLITDTEGVSIANDNSDSQIILSGNPENLKSLCNKLKCKKIIPLKVSGAFHSPFMKNASVMFSKSLDHIHFKDAIIPILSNSNPTPTNSGITLKSRLKEQMTTGVRWRETIQILKEKNIHTFVEIGPGKVLSGLAKRSMNGVNTVQISNSDDLGI